MARKMSGIRDDSDLEDFDDIDLEDDDKEGKIGIGSILKALVVIGIIAALGFFGYIFFAKGKEKKPIGIKKLFEAGENSVPLVVDGEISSERILLSEDKRYIKLSLVSAFDKRVYYDPEQNAVLYVKADGVLTLGFEDGLIKAGDDIYVDIEKLKDFDEAIVVEGFDSPVRVCITTRKSRSGYKALSLDSKEKLYVGPDSKGDYYLTVNSGETLNYLGKEGNFTRVWYKGVKGYIKTGSLKENAVSVTPLSPWRASDGQKIKLGFASVSVKEANTYIKSNVQNTKGLNVIAPTWYSVKASGVESLADGSMAAWLKKEGYKVWPVVSDLTEKLDMKELLSSYSSRKKIIDSLMKDCKSYSYDGLVVDFERIKSDGAADYLQFLRELSYECMKNNVTLSSCVYSPAAYNTYYDLAEQNLILDHVILMEYDEHYAGSEEAGSVASLGFVKGGIEKAFSLGLEKERTIVALPFYFRAWDVTLESGKNKLDSTVMRESAAKDYLAEHEADSKWDEELGQYYVYYEEGNTSYMTWVEDEKSLEEKLKVCNELKVGGVAFWRIGYEDKEVYDVIDKVY